jgi:hypothetical protein
MRRAGVPDLLRGYGAWAVHHERVIFFVGVCMGKIARIHSILFLFLLGLCFWAFPFLFLSQGEQALTPKAYARQPAMLDARGTPGELQDTGVNWGVEDSLGDTDISEERGAFPSAGMSIAYVSHKAGCNGNEPCFSSIQDAIDQADVSSLLKVTAVIYDEEILVAQSKHITILGGWDDQFVFQIGYTTVYGLTITDGEVVVSRLILEGDTLPPPPPF